MKLNEFDYVKIYGVDGGQLPIQNMVAVGNKLFINTSNGLYMLQTELPLNRFQKFIKKIFKV